jgi:hypothetical protein
MMNKEKGASALKIHKVGINFTEIQNMVKTASIKRMLAYTNINKGKKRFIPRRSLP